MAKPRLLVTRHWPSEAELAPTDVCDVTFNETDRPLSREELAQALRDFDALCVTVTDRFDAELLAKSSRTRLIANYGVGVDHIDVEAARANGIAVTNTPGVLTDATADIAMTLLLMAARRASEAEREVRAGKWSGWRPSHMVGSSLVGKTLGLVGFGRIGQAMAQRAHHGFGMKIAYHNRRELDPAIAAEFNAHFYPDMMELLRKADFVSLHVPGGGDTESMMNGGAFAAMKPGAILINTARGSVVDHDALAAALRSGHLAGAGLDVYPREPEIPSALLDLENVVLLPHLGSADRKTRNAMAERAFANVRAWASGEPLPDRVS
jgi:lactate dehydrogenase-like 2-hydroxyacid dehydrogenase